MLKLKKLCKLVEFLVNELTRCRDSSHIYDFAKMRNEVEHDVREICKNVRFCKNVRVNNRQIMQYVGQISTPNVIKLPQSKLKSSIV